MSLKKHHKDIKLEDELKEAQEETAPELAVAEDELSLAIKERDEWKDKYLRSMAEFENFRRRTNQEKSDWIKRSTEKLALQVCDVLDNFERALAQVDTANTDDSFLKGIQLIEQQLRSVLEREGIKKIDALGEEFDPNIHDALAQIPSDEFEKNIVAAVIQNGYKMNDLLIRPVKVAVSSGKPQEININE